MAVLAQALATCGGGEHREMGTNLLRECHDGLSGKDLSVVWAVMRVLFVGLWYGGYGTGLTAQIVPRGLMSVKGGLWDYRDWHTSDPSHWTV